MIADPKNIENVAEIVTKEILNALIEEEATESARSSRRTV